MTRSAMLAVFGAGAAVLAWVGWGFVGVSPLALAMTCLIACAYAFGVRELWLARQRSDFLRTAGRGPGLADHDFEPWLEQLPAWLRLPVRQRIDGAPLILPAPVFTPYLAGLLVLLGMLGTFLGMVSTFRGAMSALEGASSLEVLRAALMAPLRGLGLAFGTSVAGVAASAALGLLSVMVRRDRLDAVRDFDASLRPLAAKHSAAALRDRRTEEHRRQLLSAVSAQSETLPAVASQLSRLVEEMEQRQAAWQAQMLAQQEAFHAQAVTAYRELAQSVSTALEDSVLAAGQAVGGSVRPVLEDAIASLSKDSRELQQALLTTTDSGVRQLVAAWSDATEAQRDLLARHAQSLLDAMRDSALQAEAARTAAEEQRTHAWQSGVQALYEAGARQLESVQARLEAATSDTAQRLTAVTRSIEEPLGRVLNAAGDATSSTARLVAALEAQAVRLDAREASASEEQARWVAQLGAVMEALQDVARQHASSVQSTVAAASAALVDAAQRLDQVMAKQVGRLDDSAAQVTAGALDLAAMGDAFAQGVTDFGGHQAKLGEALAQVVHSLQQATTRSDEQLAYYLAQAREVIDLSIAAQQGIVEDLRRLHARADATEALS